MSDPINLTLTQKKILKALLYNEYYIISTCFGRVYTCSENAIKWLYSGLEGALIFAVNLKNNTGTFFLYDLKTYQLLFEFECYKKFEHNFKKTTEKFYSFDVNKGCIAFEIPNENDASAFCTSVQNCSEGVLKKKAAEFKPLSEKDLRTKAEKNMNYLINKHGFKNLPKKILKAEINLRFRKVNHMIKTVEFKDDDYFVIKGVGYKGVDKFIPMINGLRYTLDNQSKIGDKIHFNLFIKENYYRTIVNDLIIPKRKINRVLWDVEDRPSAGHENDEEYLNNQGQNYPEDNSINKIEENKNNLPEPDEDLDDDDSSKNQNPTSVPQPPPVPTSVPQPPPVPTSVPQPPPVPTSVPQPPPVPKSAPKPPPVPKSAPKPPPVPKSAPKPPPVPTGVPQPPPIPGGLPPMPMTVPILDVPILDVPKLSVPSSNNKSIDLAAELAAKKQKLKHVEIKEYESSALKKKEPGQEEDSGGSDNPLMAAIKAQRNKLKKKVGG